MRHGIKARQVGKWLNGNLQAVSVSLTRLTEMPGRGHPTRFSNPVLSNLRCIPVERPFEKHLIFYRHDESTLYVEHFVHGARDLPRRLMQPPNTEGY